jgi:hypothetical protein
MSTQTISDIKALPNLMVGQQRIAVLPDVHADTRSIAAVDPEWLGCRVWDASNVALTNVRP